MNDKDFQQQLLHLINKIEKIEDLCKAISLDSESYGPYPDRIDFDKILEDSKSKSLNFADGHLEGQSHMAQKILRILKS